MRVRQARAQDKYESHESQPHRHCNATTPGSTKKLAEVIDTQLARTLEMGGDVAVRWPQLARVLVCQMWHILTGRARRTQA